MTWPQYVPPECAHMTVDQRLCDPLPRCFDCGALVGEQTYETYDPERPRTTLDDLANLNEAVASFGVAASKTFRLQAVVHWGEGGGEAYIPAAQMQALAKDRR